MTENDIKKQKLDIFPKTIEMYQCLDDFMFPQLSQQEKVRTDALSKQLALSYDNSCYILSIM